MNPIRGFANGTLLNLVMTDVKDAIATRPQSLEDACGNEFAIGGGPNPCMVVPAEIQFGFPEFR
jgi:hypothetical protein